MYHEWRTGRPVIGPWRIRYKEAIEAGEMTELESVMDLLDRRGYPLFVPNVA